MDGISIFLYVSCLFHLYFPQASEWLLGLISCCCPTGPNLMLIGNHVISSVDASCMWSLSKNLIFLQSVAVNLCCSHVMPLFLDHLLAIPPSRNVYPCTIYLCYMGFLVGSMLDGATMKPRVSGERSTRGCAAQHALVSKLLIRIHYATTLVCFLLVSLSKIYLSFVLSGDLYIRPKSNKSSFQSCKEDNLRRN